MASENRQPRARGKLFPNVRTPCPVCNKYGTDLPSLNCLPCEKTFHTSCLDLSLDEALIIKEFYCQGCQQKHNLKIVFEHDSRVDSPITRALRRVTEPQPTLSLTALSTPSLSGLSQANEDIQQPEFFEQMETGLLGLDLRASPAPADTSAISERPTTADQATDPEGTSQERPRTVASARKSTGAARDAFGNPRAIRVIPSRTSTKSGQTLAAEAFSTRRTPTNKTPQKSPKPVKAPSKTPEGSKTRNPARTSLQPQPELPRRSRQTLSETSESDEDDQEYLVTEIIGHRIVDRENFYRVKWRSGEITVEPEENCRGCVDLVDDYRKSVGLGPSNLPRRFGATSDVETNQANWTALEDVLAAIDRFDRSKEHVPPVCSYQGPSKANYIQLLGYLNHIFVIYQSPGTKQVYLADGADVYLSEPETRTKVVRNLGFTPKGVPFVGQNAVDHCGSSAVMIALEFRRIWRNREEPAVLKAERQLYDRIKKAFHPEHSKTIEATAPLRNLVPDVCSICGKAFPQRNRRAFSAHLLSHRK